MAESAYYVDLVRDWDVPVVFTGAQRRPDQPGSDGPANILAAVSVAEEPAVRSAGGVYVCVNGEVHAARDAVKAHTWRPDAFESPGKGPVGTVAPDGFERYRELGSLLDAPGRRPTYLRCPDSHDRDRRRPSAGRPSGRRGLRRGRPPDDRPRERAGVGRRRRRGRRRGRRSGRRHVALSRGGRRGRLRWGRWLHARTERRRPGWRPLSAEGSRQTARRTPRASRLPTRSRVTESSRRGRTNT